MTPVSELPYCVLSTSQLVTDIKRTHSQEDGAETITDGFWIMMRERILIL
jgi:hypothetical protein